MTKKYGNSSYADPFLFETYPEKTQLELKEKFLAKPTSNNGECIEWAGSQDRQGYGRFCGHTAHSWAYAMFKKPLWGGHVDHLCRNTACINIDHLEEVTVQTNARKGMGQYLKDGIWYCKRDHPQIGYNIRSNGEWLTCRLCHNLVRRERREREKSQ